MEEQVASTNGTSASNGTSDLVGAHGLDPLLDALGISGQLEREAQKHAAANRATKTLATDSAVLDAYAEAVVNTIASAPFDPATSAGDAIRQREHQKNLEDRDTDEARVVEAEAHVRERM